MSGPIVRKYGFPNFDKIFGPKPILHGVEDDPAKATEASPGPKAEAGRGEEPPRDRPEHREGTSP